MTFPFFSLDIRRTDICRYCRAHTHPLSAHVLCVCVCVCVFPSSRCYFFSFFLCEQALLQHSILDVIPDKNELNWAGLLSHKSWHDMGTSRESQPMPYTFELWLQFILSSRKAMNISTWCTESDNIVSSQQKALENRGSLPSRPHYWAKVVTWKEFVHLKVKTVSPSSSPPGFLFCF